MTLDIVLRQTLRGKGPVCPVGIHSIVQRKRLGQDRCELTRNAHYGVPTPPPACNMCIVQPMFLVFLESDQRTLGSYLED